MALRGGRSAFIPYGFDQSRERLKPGGLCGLLPTMVPLGHVNVEGQECAALDGCRPLYQSACIGKPLLDQGNSCHTALERVVPGMCHGLCWDGSHCTQPVQVVVMTPEHARQLLDAQKDEERPLIFVPPKSKAQNPNRIFKDW